MNVVSKIGVAVEIEQARENDFGLTSDWLKKKPVRSDWSLRCCNANRSKTKPGMMILVFILIGWKN